MLLNKKRIKETVKKGNDFLVIETIEDEVNKNHKYFEEFIDLTAFDGLINMLYKMNFIIIETENYGYASTYNYLAQELYYEMKKNLAIMLDFEDLWEV